MTQPAPRPAGPRHARGDWEELLEAVGRGELQLHLVSRSGHRVVVLSQEELESLQAAARVPPAGEQLTVRQREVLRHVEAGLSASEVAERLGLSAATVVQHLAAARRHFGVRTSVEAATRARAAGALG